MSAILVLKNTERNSRHRAEDWARLERELGTLSITPNLLSLNENIGQAKVIFTHRVEYDSIIQSIVNLPTPTMVFSGGVSTAHVDKNRVETIWLPFTLLAGEVDASVRRIIAKSRDANCELSDILDFIRRELAVTSYPYPEALTAAYLLIVAKEKRIGVSLDSLTVSQWKVACKQYKDIGGDENADWSDASGWDKNRIEAIKGEIGKLFLPATSPSR